VVMGIKKRQYTKEQKKELVQALLSVPRLYRRGTHLNRLLSVPFYREFALIPAFTGGDFPLD